MDFDQIFSEKIQEAVDAAIAEQLPKVVKQVMDARVRPEYTSWGRYLTLEQARRYCGYSSTGGLDTFLTKHGIKRIKNSRKDVKVDREAIDKAMVRDVVQDYLKNSKRSSHV